MTNRQRKKILDDIKTMQRNELELAFLRALENLSALTVVLETYIGTPNVIRIAMNPNDEEFISSLTGAIKPDRSLFEEANAFLGGSGSDDGKEGE